MASSFVDFFGKLAPEFDVAEAHIGAYGGAQIGAVQIQDEPSGDFAKSMEYDSELIATMQLRISGLTIAY